METLLKKILIENKYELKTQNIQYYSNQDKSFYFWINCEETDLKKLLNKQLLSEDTRYSSILESFKALVNNGDQVTIEKNSSLIILVHCEHISSLADLHQQILLLEEDEYFLKKYVILYTNESIKGLDAMSIVPILHEKIDNNDSFKRFAKEGYIDELAQYILILQLFIKLPFLKLAFDASVFSSLNGKLIAALDNLAPFHERLLSNFEKFRNVDFLDPADDEKINKLLNLL